VPVPTQKRSAVRASHARSKNAFFGFLVLRHRADSNLRHRQDCLCYSKQVLCSRFFPSRGTAPRTHAGSSTCRARTRQKHSHAMHGLYRTASALCRTYGASRPRIVNPGLPPWASFCRAYGAHATPISHSCFNRARLERESGTLAKHQRRRRGTHLAQRGSAGYRMLK